MRNNNFNHRNLDRKSADSSKYWIADIFYENVEYFNSKKEFEDAYSEMVENKCQFTFNEPS